jgi:hypothetical protein
MACKLFLRLYTISDIPLYCAKATDIAVHVPDGGNGVLHDSAQAIFANDFMNKPIRQTRFVNFIVSLSNEFGPFFIYIRFIVRTDNFFPAVSPYSASGIIDKEQISLKIRLTDTVFNVVDDALVFLQRIPERFLPFPKRGFFLEFSVVQFFIHDRYCHFPAFSNTTCVTTSGCIVRYRMVGDVWRLVP